MRKKDPNKNPEIRKVGCRRIVWVVAERKQPHARRHEGFGDSNESNRFKFDTVLFTQAVKVT